LVYDNLLIGVLRMQFRADALIDQGQLHFLNAVAPRIALALAMSIAGPQQLMQAKAEARSDERREVAHELHDSLAQHLSYLHLSLDRLSVEAEQVHDESLRQELGGLREIAAEAYHQVRDQLALLRARQNADLIQSLRYYTQVVSQRSRVRVSFVTRGEPVQLTDGLPSHVFGLVRESLNNVQRHARAYEAQVVLFWSEDLLIVAVTDDGVGFDPAAQFEPDHHGLTMLRERIASLHGQLHIHSAPHHGTRLFFYLPLDQNVTKAVNQ
jgi:signal transduction histidine kinase